MLAQFKHWFDTIWGRGLIFAACIVTLQLASRFPKFFPPATPVPAGEWHWAQYVGFSMGIAASMMLIAVIIYSVPKSNSNAAPPPAKNDLER